ncbi:MAG: hypothetical protein GY853_03510 [PVC group bacterium]|nr:hypothetical protein [PVC group bacterium]
MRKILLFIVICAIFSTSLVFAEKQDKVKLKYEFKVGDTLNYNLKVDGKVEIEIKPATGRSLPKNTAKMQGSFSYMQEVTEVDDISDTAKIQVSYGNANMDTIIGDQTIPNAEVAALNGKVALLTVAKDGKVKNYDMPDGLPASFQGSDFTRLFVEFPEHALRRGESWFRQSESSEDAQENISAKHVTNSKYTFLTVEQRGAYSCAKVRLESETSSYTTSNKNDLSLEGVIKGKISGIIYYDLVGGYVVYSEVHTALDNEIVTKVNTETPEAEATGSITTILNTTLHTITELL